MTEAQSKMIALQVHRTNSEVLNLELDWFTQVRNFRIDQSNSEDLELEPREIPDPPSLDQNESHYAKFIRAYNLNKYERFILILGLVPYLRPQLLDIFLQVNPQTNTPYTNCGGIVGKDHRGMIPTAETAVYLIAGDSLELRIEIIQLFGLESTFVTSNILFLEPSKSNEPKLSGVINITPETLDMVTIGVHSKPDFNAKFPAQLMTSKLEWQDLILSPQTSRDVSEISHWLEHHKHLQEAWEMDRFMKPGYRALFYGPPGTGKSLSATLMAKRTGQDVYRIDLSKVVSKYIGETEKNLARVFDRAERKDWILFFDEADALFGKRTGLSDAHDRYANQEVSYLLQRIEDYDGLIILASNLKSNLDDAFIRRFNSMVHFRPPGVDERLRLWQNYIPSKCQLEPNCDLRNVAKKYDVTGAAVVNAVQYAAIQSARRGTNILKQNDLIQGVKREFEKAGLTI